MANSSDSLDDDATVPGLLVSEDSAASAQEPALAATLAAGSMPGEAATAAELLEGAFDAPAAVAGQDGVEGALAPAATDGAAGSAGAADAEETPTLPQPRRLALELAHGPTAIGSATSGNGRTWTFGDGGTLDAESMGRQRAGSSALDALLADIERSFAGAAESVQPGPLIGHANRFQLMSRLGHGGMGVVFRAFDHELRRYIAIKLLAPAQLWLGEGGVDRFLRNEARAIAALSHPNIVQVFDISSWCDVPFLVMECLEGRSLDDFPSDPMPVPRVLSIADQLLSGLEHAHGHGVIHRDLKPSNLFETTRGDIKILDFGIASLSEAATLAGELRRSADASGVAAAISGTPGYMSPEQWLGPQQDARTDVWAVGMLLMGMLTGRPLYADRSASEVRREVLGDRPTLAERDYRVPRPLFRVLERALEKDPSRRYQTAAQLRQALADAAVVLGHGGRARTALAPEQRQLTLVATSLSIDGVGDFETAAEILRTWHNTVSAIVQRASGFVMSSVGATIVACFGYPAAQEDDAVRAVGVACAIRDTSAELMRPGSRHAKVRIGVDTGSGVVEEVPVSAGGVPVLHGPAAQIAAQLRERAEPGTLLISASTAELTRGYFTVTPVTAATSGGVASRDAQPAAFVVVGPRPMVSRFEAAMSELAPLVGRDAELEVQDLLWQEAAHGRGEVYCLIGDAGVGKSRLVHRLRQRVIADGGVVLTCQCWPQMVQSPFHPLISLLQQALELDAAASSASSPAERAQLQLVRLERALARLGFDSVRDVAVFAAMLALPAPAGAPPPVESAEAQRRATIDRVTGLIERLAERAPLAFVIEDLHWADHSTLDFLDYLLPRVSGHRLLLTLTARREVEPFWRQRARCHERELSGLSPEVARELVRHLHGKLGAGEPLPPRLVDDIVERSSGLPLYLEELTRACAQRADGQALAGATPPTLLGLLGARLDQLSASARATAQLGAVLGRDFRNDLLEALTAEVPLVAEAHERTGPIAVAGRAGTSSGQGGIGGAGLAELDGALDELCDKGLVQRLSASQGTSYVFRHALMYDVAYQTMPPEQRRARHSQVADLLVRWNDAPHTRPPEAGAVSPELIAYHYDQAGRVELALQHWERAGQAAAKKWAVKEATGHFTRALQLLETSPPEVSRDETELRLLLALGPPLMSVHGYAAPRVEDTYARAYDLCIRHGRHAQTFPPLVGLWQYNMVGGNLDKAATLGTRLLTLADGVADSTMKLIAMRAVGTTRFLQGDVPAAIEHTRAGWQLYDRGQHGELAFKHGNDPGVGHGIYLAWALWQAGYPDRALAQGQATLQLARSLAHPMSVAFSLCYSAIICNLRGEFAAAEVMLVEAIAVADENQLGLWKALALIQLGWSQAARGDIGGVALMVRGISAWRQTGARAGTTFFHVALGQAQLIHGDRAAAAESLDTAAALVTQNGEHFYEPELLRSQAMLLDVTTQAREISELYDRALALATAQSSRSWSLRLWSARVELEHAQELQHALSEPDRAADAQDRRGLAAARAGLEECLRWFSEGQDTADLRHAAALLERGQVIDPESEDGQRAHQV